ncbi:OmpA family protein [Nocardiopsis quinghaiensis]|uniref:OmpA family protein n=1 Tax=Nocardiopsis quinghaiensis TaxID=464995 RepID=UPI00123B321E|nr:OmpA family protein [Nocardiopsis quinghaiensis]
MTHQRLRQLAALVTTLALLAGLPWLATTLTWPELDLSPTSLEVHLRSGRLPEGVGTAVLLLLLWSLWGLYSIVLAVEAIGRLRRQRTQVRFLRPLQLLAATTLGAVTVSPAVAQAAPTPVVAAETPQGAEDEQDQSERESSAEPFIVDRSRLIDSFGYDSAGLTEEMTEDVKATADLIAQHGAPELPVIVTGHTDAAGDSDYNLDLSERRAEAVAKALRTHLGQDMVIEVHGEGDSNLLDTDDAAEQRRVEISYSVLVTPPTEPDTPAESNSTGAEENAEDVQGPAVGLSLPSGLVLAMTTGAAGVLAGMVIERRRELLPAQHGGDDEEADDEHTTVEASSRSTAPARAGDGHKAGKDLALIDLARAPGLGVTGPGAQGAARTLLARALETAESDLTVVVTGADLRTLLEDTRRPPQLSEDAPVMVTDSVEDAITLLQLQVLARHRAEDEQEEDKPEALGGPQFVLLTRADTAVAKEITSLLSHTGRAPLSAVLLGAWPDGAGATCTIDADGTIAHADEPFTDIVGHRWAPTTSADLHQALTHQSTTAPDDAAEQDHDHEAEPRTPESASPPPSSEESTATRTRAVSVTVLGRITLAVHGQQVRPHRRAAYEVLAYLATHPAGVRLEAAVDAMWPHDAPHRGIRRFHDACTAVRTACRPLLGEDGGRVITHDGDLYQLNRDLVVCDLWRIEQLLEEAAHSEDAATLVTTAAAMFDDDFAVHTDYVWAEGVRTRIRDQLVTTLTTCAGEAEPRRAISMLQRALRIDPTAAEAAQALAKTYDEKADSKSAERVREAHRSALAEAEASS